jgi:tetratricopeptide (TPR) repeat protein
MIALESARDALKLGDMPTAARYARQMMVDHPMDDAVCGFAAAVLLAAGQFAEALTTLQALPESVDRLHAMALACIKLERTDEARTHLMRLLEIAPDDLDAQRRLKALDGPPAPRTRNSDHPADKALRKGDLKRGFRLMADYMRQESAPARDPSRFSNPVPHWRGQPVKHLLVIGSAGDGDTLQFARYLKVAQSRVKRMTVAVRPPLVGLLQRSGFDVAGLFAITDLMAQADAQIELMALPSALEPTYGQTSHYLRATPRDYGPGFHVGVNWAASEDSGIERTVDVSALEPLNVPGVTFHCLTFGKRATEAPAWIKPLQVGDYADTADAMAGLDLVITVDSSPAHLAGAIGVPVWVPLGKVADWRFESHPHRWRWYSTAKLFRGPQAFERMAAELRRRNDPSR